MKVDRINRQLLRSKNAYVRGYRLYEMEQPLPTDATDLETLGYNDAKKYYGSNV